ncbi:MAG TPA: hypothetical protein DCE14_05035 [Kosmotogaceae bacterium]|nr:MAG: Uncharacterized protein XE05_0778 [Thermotogales bacterium 46_20]HAA85703.1 hypothetical protein [Kosmotogaceae bacterium]
MSSSEWRKELVNTRRFTLSPVFILGLGVILVSFSGVLIRLAGTGPSRIALYRVVFAFVMYVAVTSFRRRRVASLPFNARQYLLAILAGVFLALHFHLWISAFEHTTIAGAVIPLSLQPIVVGVISRYLYGEKFDRFMLIPIGLMAGGMIIMPALDRMISPTLARGDLLSIAGALMVCMFVVIARTGVRHFGTFGFNKISYGVAMIILAVFAFVQDVSIWPLTLRELFFYVLIGVGCSFLGYSLIVFSLKKFRSVNVSIALIGEPVLGILWGWVFLREALTFPQFIGFSCGLVGLTFYFRRIKVDYE